MSYQVLARKWRPRHFGELVGQEHVVRALTNGLDGGRVHHAFLFTGTRGVGKTTIARILAKCLNCETGITSRPCGECAVCREVDEGRFVDLLEVDAASRAKVDQTRELMDNVQFSPTRGRFKVYLIDEVHMFSAASFNALLKTLEEPPEHVKFVLATTDPQKVPITVLSRCLQFNLKRLPAELIVAHLQRVLAAESVPVEEGALRPLARAADGSMRDALSLLDQAIAYGGGALRAAEVRTMLGVIDDGFVFGLLARLGAGDTAGVLELIDAMVAQAVDLYGALGALLSSLQRIAVGQMLPAGLDPDDPEDAACLELAAAIAPEDVQLFYQVALHGRRDLPLAPDPRVGFEMTLLRMLTFRPADAATPGPGPVKPRADTASGPAPASVGAASTPARSAASAGARAGPPARDAPALALESLTPEHWPDVVAVLPLGGLARELAANCTLIDCAGDTVHLRIGEGHRQLTADGIRGKLAAALREAFGSQARLDIAIGEAAGDTPAQLERKRAHARQVAAVAAIASDPGVQEICDTFGVEVQPDQVRPLD